MKKFIPSIIILLIFNFASCINKNKVLLQSEPHLSFDVTVQSKLVEVDNVQRLYVVTKDNSIIRYGDDYKEIFRYANRRSGDITDINASNPIKILVYCRDFGNVILLDNTLALIEEFSLSSYGFTDISAVGVSNDNGYWIFDPLRFRLIKLDISGQILFESVNVQDYGIFSPNITRIVESGNRVILLDSNNGFYVFDNFGQYLRHIPVKNIISFRFDGNILTYYTESGLFYCLVEFADPMKIQVTKDEFFPIPINIIYTDKGFLKVFPHGINFKPLTK
ncbi:MAG: hypothetical protein WAT79_11675 [Saprospiraceae bacterium]